MTEYEKKNYKSIYEPMRAVMPATIRKDGKNLHKITESVGNWDIYTDGKYMYSVAKPFTGAGDTQYGDIRHIKRMIKEGHIERSELTKLGRRLLRAEGMKI